MARAPAAIAAAVGGGWGLRLLLLLLFLEKEVKQLLRAAGEEGELLLRARVGCGGVGRGSCVHACA